MYKSLNIIIYSTFTENLFCKLFDWKIFSITHIYYVASEIQVGYYQKLNMHFPNSL